MKRAFLLVALGAMLGSGRGAAAQDNSLFRHRPAREAAEVPTTQPVGTALPGMPAAASNSRSTLEARRPAEATNAVHRDASPIAVATPELEAIKTNDLITIIVRISKSATSDSKLESKKDWQHEWALDQWIRLSDQHGVVPAKFTEGKPAVGFDYTNDYKGDGKYDRSDSLTTRVQARVIDVKPNGNLILEARNDVSFGEEDYTVTLTGTCRGRDVTPENTVLSSQVADLSVKVDDRGAVRDATRRGWLQRGLDFLRPF